MIPVKTVTQSPQITIVRLVENAKSVQLSQTIEPNPTSQSGKALLVSPVAK